MKVHQKLVRDKILEIIEQEGVKHSSRVLDDKEFKKELLHKLVEEAIEVQNADNSDDQMKEIADVMEVLEAIIKEFKFDDVAIRTIKENRHNSRGGFEKKIYLESTDE